MTHRELFELQSTLVACLSSPDCVRQFRSGAAWNSLSFLDSNLVQLLSSLYQGKRVDKLTKVLPKTLTYLSGEMGELTTAFLERHPPLNADSYTAGCQFYGFLRRRWRTRAPTPPFLPDLAYCELARIGVERQATGAGPPALTDSCLLGRPEPIFIRRRRDIRLHAFDYDIRPLFDRDEIQGQAVTRQRVWIVMSRPLGSVTGKMYGLDDRLFAMLRSWRPWTEVSVGGEPSRAERTLTLLRRLEELGIVEVRI